MPRPPQRRSRSRQNYPAHRPNFFLMPYQPSGHRTLAWIAHLVRSSLPAGLPEAARHGSANRRDRPTANWLPANMPYCEGKKRRRPSARGTDRGNCEILDLPHHPNYRSRRNAAMQSA